jgi:hypothetical protein
MVRFSTRTTAAFEEALAAATGTALALAAIAAVAFAGAALWLGGELRGAFLALAAVFPALLLQDTWRFAFFAAGRGAKAAANDSIFLATLLATFVAMTTLSVHGVAWYIVAWGWAAGAAAVVGFLQARVRPRPREARRWLTEQHDLGLPYLGEFAAVGAGELALFAVAGLLGLAAAGALRGGQILIGPLRVLFMGLRLAAVPEAARLAARRPAGLVAPAAKFSALLVVAAVTWGGVLRVLPAPLGHALLGASWHQARGVIVPLALAMAATGAMTGAFAGLRGLAAARRSFRSRLAVAPFLVSASLTGAAIGGAPGAAWGVAIVSLLAVGFWWLQFFVALSEHGRRTAPPTPLASGEGRAY